MMRRLSRLTVAHPTLLAFPNRRPSYPLSHMHHSRHLPLVLHSIQGKMRRFLHHRTQRVYRTVLPHHHKHVFPHLSPDHRLGLHLINCQLLASARIDHPARLPSNLVRQVGHTLERLLRRVPPAEAYHRLSAHTFVPRHLLATPCRRPQLPIWAICTSTQPSSTHRTFPARAVFAAQTDVRATRLWTWTFCPAYFVGIVIFLGATVNHIVPNFAVSTDIT